MAREIDIPSLQEVKKRLESLLEYFQEISGNDHAFVSELEKRLATTSQALRRHAAG